VYEGKLLSVLSYPNFWWRAAPGNDTAVKRACDLPEYVVCLFGLVVKGGVWGVGCVSVVHHHSRNFACEQRTKKKKQTSSKTTRTTKPHKNGSVDFDAAW